MHITEEPVPQNGANPELRFVFHKIEQAGIASRTASHRGGT